MKEPEYYAENGLSPLQAFKQGFCDVISTEKGDDIWW